VGALPAFGFDRDSAPPATTEEERILEAKEKGEEKFPVGLNVSFSQGIGGATFVEDKYTRRSAYDISLDVMPYWRFTDFFRFVVRTIATQSVVENADSVVTYQNRLQLSDTVVGFQHLRILEIPLVEVGVRGELTAALPTSPVSQFRGLIASPKTRWAFSRSLGPVFLQYGASFYKNLNRYETSYIDESVMGEHVALAHFNGNEQLTGDHFAAGPGNLSFGFINDFLVSWNMTDELALALYYEINNGWTYQSFPKDDLSSEFAVGGRAQRDATRGIVDVTYQFTPQLSVSVGTDTVVLPKTADNKAFVFPFANLSNNYRNSTQIYFGINGAF